MGTDGICVADCKSVATEINHFFCPYRALIGIVSFPVALPRSIRF